LTLTGKIYDIFHAVTGTCLASVVKPAHFVLGPDPTYHTSFGSEADNVPVLFPVGFEKVCFCYRGTVSLLVKEA
jgi:hypothetical protein